MPSISDGQNAELSQRAKEVFLPYTPIKLVELFRGREKEIQRVTEALSTPGRHVVLFGDRGVGKTSLANLISFFANWDDANIFKYSCSTTDTFSTVFDAVFAQTGNGLLSRESVRQQVKNCGSNLFWFQSRSEERLEPIEQFQVEPGTVASTLEELSVLVILDEFDRVESDDAKLAIAELVKKLSDSEAKSKLLIVGVASTIVELIGKHPSAVRAFEQVEMSRMAQVDIEEILRGGFLNIGISIDDSLVRRVAALSDGYPHFAHLLGLKLVQAALDRLVKSEGEHLGVLAQDYPTAVTAAISGSMHSLKEAYICGTETSGVKTQMYRLILEGIAVQDNVEVPLQDILDYVNKVRSEKTIQAQAISPHLGKLVNQENRNILARPRKGFYRFQDPMLRAYVRMQIAEMKLNQQPAYRQLSFAFT